jgi:predicted nucleotidyltransferase
MKPNLLLGYAADFVGFFLASLSRQELALVRQVVLFGSVARNTSGDASDVDLFIDTPDPASIEPHAEAAIEGFEKSVKVRDYWRLLGVHSPISLKVGDTAAWEALAPALREDGRVLYGPCRIDPLTTTPKVLLSWENISSGKARTNLYRNLFGYISNRKRYPGLLARHHGERITKGAILIPLESLPIFQELFKRLCLTCQLRTLFEESIQLSGRTRD